MSKPIFVFCLGTSLLVISCWLDAEAQSSKAFRIGYLMSGNPNLDSPRAEAIRGALSELGYIEGQNIRTEYRYANGELNELPALAANLVDLKVDLILAAGGDGIIRAAKDATKTIPIVMVGQGSDPVGAGLIQSLSRPGSNVTGLTNLLVQLGGKRLQLLKDAVPKISRVAIPYISQDRTHRQE